MWLLVCREKGKGSFCTLGNQRAFHTGISPSIKASSFVINAQDAIKYYTTPLLPLNIYPSLIIIQSSSTHFYFPRIHRNLFLTGIYVVQGLLGLAIIHAGALRTCDPLLLLLLICCISEAIISNLDANSCWLFFPHIHWKSFRATFSDTRCVIGVTGFNNLVLYFSRSVSRKKKGENTNFRHLCQSVSNTWFSPYSPFPFLTVAFSMTTTQFLLR